MLYACISTSINKQIKLQLNKMGEVSFNIKSIEKKKDNHTNKLKKKSFWLLKIQYLDQQCAQYSVESSRGHTNINIVQDRYYSSPTIYSR